MLRRTRKSIAVLAVGGLLALGAGVPLERPAEAQDAHESQAELVDRLLADDLTRAEMVSLYESLAVLEYQPPACVPGEELFDDVPATDPFCPWVQDLALRGITIGCGDGMFCPEAAAQRAQLAVLLVRALEAVPEGPPGPQGPPGVQGEVGPVGSEGSQGDTGPQGPEGSQGAQGPEGPQGAQGPEGPQGAQGPEGLQGATGLMGPQGDIGPMGPGGPQGPTGFPGPVGPQGPQGPQGEPGIADLQTVTATCVIAESGEPSGCGAVAHCPSGKRIVSGGVYNLGLDLDPPLICGGLVVAMSAANGTTAWQGLVWRPLFGCGFGPYTVHVQAICADIPTAAAIRDFEADLELPRFESVFPQ